MNVMLPQWVQNGFVSLIQPLVRLFIKARINPNFFTTLGLVFNIFAAVAFSLGAKFGGREDLFYLAWGGAFVFIGGICDIIDGKVARAAGLSTKFGALYDSVLDRYSEVIMFFGMGYYLIAHSYFYETVAMFFALGGSVMVSYVRSRAEALNIDCKVGLMQRPERIVWLASGAFLCGTSPIWLDPGFVFDVSFLPFPLFKPIYIFTLPIFIVAVLANFTAIQRMHHSYKTAKSLETGGQTDAVADDKEPMKASGRDLVNQPKTT